jgi:hypothetical protein
VCRGCHPCREELGDPCCLWTPESKNPKGFRVTNLSHPGEAGEDGAKSAPKCGDAEKAAPPSTGAPDSTKAAPAPKKSDMRPVDAADPTPDSGYGGEAPVTEAAPKYDSGYDYPAATAAPSYGGEKPAVDYASEGKCGRYNEVRLTEAGRRRQVWKIERGGLTPCSFLPATAVRRGPGLL